MIPGKEGLEFHVIVWKLTTQFSGQTQTVDTRGLIIIVRLFIIINNKRTRHDVTSQTFKVASNSGMLVILYRGTSGTGTHNMTLLVNKTYI